MLNTMIVAAVTPFSGTTSTDKNGEAPVMLQCIAGTMPNRNVLSGTVARRSGIEIGKTYLLNVRENGNDVLFGADYTFMKITELTTGLDIIKASKELGEARIQFVPRVEDFDQKYQRKSNAVESQRTVRAKEGFYTSNNLTSTIEHDSAIAVLEGSSVNSGGKILISDEEQQKLVGAKSTNTSSILTESEK